MLIYSCWSDQNAQTETTLSLFGLVFPVLHTQQRLCKAILSTWLLRRTVDAGNIGDIFDIMKINLKDFHLVNLYTCASLITVPKCRLFNISMNWPSSSRDRTISMAFVKE